MKSKLLSPSRWMPNSSYEIYLLQGLFIASFVHNYGVNGISMLGIFTTLVLIAYVARVLAGYIEKRFLT